MTLTGDIFSATNPADFGIVGFVKKTFTYVSAGADNDDLVATITYKDNAANIKGVLTIAYVGSTNNILSIERTT